MNFKFCAKCGHTDNNHILGGLCVHEGDHGEGCGCTGFVSGISKVHPTRPILDELLAFAWEQEQIHEPGFALEERIDRTVNVAAKLHGWL